MTAREIANRLLDSAKGLTPARVQKARALAQRTGHTWEAVIAAMTPEEFELVRRVQA